MTITRNRLGSAFAVTALLVALTACSSDGGEPKSGPEPTASGTSSATSDPTASSSATPLPTLSADPNTGKYDYCKDQKPFTGDAADEFGADNVADAYCTMVTLEMTQSFIDRYLRATSDDLTVKDFSAWHDYMTQDAINSWDAKVEKALKSDDINDKQQVWALMFYDAAGGNSGYDFTDDGPAVLNQSFSPAKTAVMNKDGDKTLVVYFTVSGDLNLVKSGTDDHYLIPVTREVSFALVPNPAPDADQKWLINGWNGHFTVGDPKKRPPLASASPTDKGSASTAG